MITYSHRPSRLSLGGTKTARVAVITRSMPFSEYAWEKPPPISLPPEIQVMIIEQVAADIGYFPDASIYSPMTRDTLRALCTVNKFFESIAIRHLYTLVHLTNATQLAAFRKAVAYFNRPTALAKYVRTFSISSATHIASFQLADDLAAVLHVLWSSLEHLTLDIRRRHHFRQTPTLGAQDVGILQNCTGRHTRSIVGLLSNPWPRLAQVCVTEGMYQYQQMPGLPYAFNNVRRLALGYTVVTAEFIDQLLKMPSLELLVMANSAVRWSDFESTTIEMLMGKFTNLRQIIWYVTQRPKWDIDEHMSPDDAMRDAQRLKNIPKFEVTYELRSDDPEELLSDGLPGPRFLGRGAMDGFSWTETPCED